MGWDPNAWNVNIISKSSPYIHYVVMSAALNLHMFVTVFYGLNTPSGRKALWSDLISLAPSINLPWCLLGDFNEVISISEIIGGNDSWDSGMQDFLDCTSDLHLADLRAVGSSHSWWNSSDSKPIFKKLDRALVNDLWLQRFPLSQDFFTPRDLSYHCPVVVKTVSIQPSSPKSFQFFNFMLDLDNFHEVVRNAWNGYVPGDPLQILARKLKDVKMALCILNKANENLSSLVDKARAAL